MAVYWLQSARENLRKALHGQAQGFGHWMPCLNAVLDEVFRGQVILVRERYSGYRPFAGLVILFVEVQPLPDGTPTTVHGRLTTPGSYIIKIAFDDKRADLKTEIDAWNSARPEHLYSDNVFVSLTAHPSATAPVALIYGDANAVLGQENVLSLETAIAQSCRFGVPGPDSIHRVLRTLYGRLNTLFFSNCHPESADVYLHATKPDLTGLLRRYDETATPPNEPEHKNDLLVRQFRRETLGLLAGRHEEYADPIDLLRGLQRANTGPQILRGTAHGDLHARNIQVAIDHDEAVSCAVYDYEKFSDANFVAWDFIKFEIETAVRLLAAFGDPANLPRFVEQCLGFWKRVAERTEAHQSHLRVAAQNANPASGPEWQRLEDLLVAVRLMAHEHLGRNQTRVFDWLAEYELLTAWYAARAAMYPNYEQRLSVAALVAGGVAARRLIRRLPAEVELSHRRRYEAAKTLARGQGTLNDGAAALEALAGDYPHVLEVNEELALARIKQGQFSAAEEILEGIARRYDHTSAETPSLLGSLWKRRAFATTPVDVRALESSLKWYRRAIERHPDEHYPRINVATLLVLLGQRQESRDEAQRVLHLLENVRKPDFWTVASRGEAKLLLGIGLTDTLSDYRQAGADPDCCYQDRQSMYDQIVRLRQHLPAATRDQLTDAALRQLFNLTPPESQP